MSFRTIEWVPDIPGRLAPGRIRLLDQTRLPLDTIALEVRDLETVRDAIVNLRIRGAPAIGIAAAMGMVLALQELDTADAATVQRRADAAAERLAGSRPTAVNLFRALDRMRACVAAHTGETPAVFRECLAREALAILEEERDMARRIGEFGAALLEDGQSVLTHCNAGSLATAAYGTALAPVYVAAEQGKHIHVFADETRPLLQGARLTAWELQQHGIPVTLICDSVAASLLKSGRVAAVLVGADRIAANGDTANKIGTYGVALHARAHGIPFYVLAPTSTIDMDCPSGDAIPIEERGAEEVTEGFGRRTAPAGVAVYAPAFDVTPASLITAIICEHGLLRPDYGRALRRVTAAARAGR